MTLTNHEKKVLKYIQNHSNCTYTKLFKKFSNTEQILRMLEVNHFISSQDPNDCLMGNNYDDLKNPTTYCIEHDGIAYLESHNWFNFEFLVKDFLIPIAVSIITTLVTLYLTGELSLFQ